MKVTNLCLSILLTFSTSAYADKPHYIEASIQVSGEFVADTTILLQAGKPAKIEWIDETGPDYILMIPDVSMKNGMPNVFGMLLKRDSGKEWRVITESNSLGNYFSLLGLSNDNSLLTISARTVSKTELDDRRRNISLLTGEATVQGGCCTAGCTDGSNRLISCCGGCCSDGVCGAGCCP